MNPTAIEKKIAKLLPKSFQQQLPRGVTVVTITEKESQRLSRRYRGKDAAANVLSFRYSPDYGEILICPSVIHRDAKMQGNSYGFQLTWMIVHGMIHLAGRHHEGSKSMAERSERIEHLILRKLFAK